MSECSERRGQNGLHTFQLSISVPFDELQIYDSVSIRHKEWELDQIDGKILYYSIKEVMRVQSLFQMNVATTWLNTFQLF